MNIGDIVVCVVTIGSLYFVCAVFRACLDIKRKRSAREILAEQDREAQARKREAQEKLAREAEANARRELAKSDMRKAEAGVESAIAEMASGDGDDDLSRLLEKPVTPRSDASAES